MYRLPLRRIAAVGPSRLPFPTVPRASLALRAYASRPSLPRPSRNTPTPAGLESVFGGKAGPKGTTSGDKPNLGSPSEPHKPDSPDVPSPSGPHGKPSRPEALGPEEQKGEDGEEDGKSWAERRPRLSDEFEKGGKKRVATGGGGGGGGGGSGGPGGPGGFGGLTPNQLLLAALS